MQGRPRAPLAEVVVASATRGEGDGSGAGAEAALAAMVVRQASRTFCFCVACSSGSRSPSSSANLSSRSASSEAASMRGRTCTRLSSSASRGSLHSANILFFCFCCWSDSVMRMHDCLPIGTISNHVPRYILVYGWHLYDANIPRSVPDDPAIPDKARLTSARVIYPTLYSEAAGAPRRAPARGNPTSKKSPTMDA